MTNIKKIPTLDKAGTNNNNTDNSTAKSLKSVSKNTLIINYLKSPEGKAKGLTNMECYTHFGSTRLCKIASESKGLISGEWENGVDRYGKHCQYKRYFYRGK